MKIITLILLLLTLWIPWCYSGEPPLVNIDIDETQTFQEMDGFGASLTDSSAWLLYHILTPDEQKKVMAELFSYETGIGLSYLRQPMGASDFALKNYTYADTPEDDRLEHFSIAYDEAYIIPLLQQALKINPRLQIMGSPWSAPAWMKESNDLNRGQLKNELYALYADYFLKYVQAYAAKGLPIHAITLQNEPQHEPCSYPCMRMKVVDQAKLAKLIGERFQKDRINTKIVVWDHNWDNPDEVIAILNDHQANPYIAGSAFHCYAGDVSAQSKVVAAHPNKEVYFTECSGGGWSEDFANNLLWDVSTLVIGTTRHWAKTVLKWNIALDENSGPQNGGCSNCRGVITINQHTGQVTKNVEYYSLGHISKFVRPGTKRIYSTNLSSGEIQNVAFINPDGLIAVIVLNTADNERMLKMHWKEEAFSYTLPSHSVATFTWSNILNSTVSIWLTTGDQKQLLEKQRESIKFSK